MRLRLELMQLEIGISTRRYLPASGTAGLERSLVSGNSRDPAPPPMITARTFTVLGADRFCPIRPTHFYPLSHASASLAMGGFHGCRGSRTSARRRYAQSEKGFRLFGGEQGRSAAVSESSVTESGAIRALCNQAYLGSRSVT